MRSRKAFRGVHISKRKNFLRVDFRRTGTVAAPWAVSSEAILQKVLLHQHVTPRCPKNVSNVSVLKAVQRKSERIIWGSSNVVASPGWITMSQISLYYFVLNSPEDI
jgi:hypothetical protein